MKLPIHHVVGVPENCDVEFFDDDKQYISPPEVSGLINNAAAGPWEEGPIPDGKKEGEELLICYEAIEPSDSPYTSTVTWINGQWRDWKGKTPLMSVEIFAHINTYVAKEVTK